MALELLQAGREPAGQYDGYDSIYLTVRGGEVGTLVHAPMPPTDRASADVDDGYVHTTTLGNFRPAVTTTLVSGSRPLFLIDDGVAGYGTMFGSVLGGICGQLTNGTVLGPHTATGSGKLTIWDKPGFYAVTLDAVDTDPIAGLQITNNTLDVGVPLYATTAGLLTPDAAKQFENVAVARFVNFEPNKGGSLVNTPISLVSAQNSPTGQLAIQRQLMTRAVFNFNPPVN